jgi:hypothetical protein
MRTSVRFGLGCDAPALPPSVGNRERPGAWALKPATLFAVSLALSYLGRPPVLIGQTGSGVLSPQALVGDWEWVINGPVKATLHMTLDAGGGLKGVVDIPGVPKPVELTNIHLSGRALTYTMPPMPALTEQISADGNSMAGTQPWNRIRTTLIPARQLAGNWEFIGPVRDILRLRTSGDGELIGKLDEFSVTSTRQALTAVHLDGNTFSYKMADGKVFKGELSNDGSIITGKTSGSTMLIIFTHVQTEAQALIEDAKEKPSLTDGVWSGTVRTDSVTSQIKPPNNLAPVTFYLKSNPADCAFDFPAMQSTKHIPCVINLHGNHMHIQTAFATFDGIVTSDKLSGTWTMAKEYKWGPLSLDLTRLARTAQ